MKKLSRFTALMGFAGLGAFLGGTLGWSETASAQPRPSSEPADPPKISLDVPEPSTRVRRTYHMHEGFYLRTSLGFGNYRSSFSDDSRADFSADGGSLAFDLLIGGGPSRGVTIGGALLVETLVNGSYESGGTDVDDHVVTSALIGPFIDGFPDATKGWHLGGMVGLAAQRFTDINLGNDEAAEAGGFGGAAWFGYDFWVADEWAVGPELRLMAMRTLDTRSNVDVSAWARSFTLSFTGVYN